MTNIFIPALGRQPLYCVWIKTGNPSRPLACVWIDPLLRGFQLSDAERKIPSPVRPDNSQREIGSLRLAEKRLFSKQTVMLASEEGRNES
jgi:hypothetical protein